MSSICIFSKNFKKLLIYITLFWRPKKKKKERKEKKECWISFNEIFQQSILNTKCRLFFLLNCSISRKIQKPTFHGHIFVPACKLSRKQLIDRNFRTIATHICTNVRNITITFNNKIHDEIFKILKFIYLSIFINL